MTAVGPSERVVGDTDKAPSSPAEPGSDEGDLPPAADRDDSEEQLASALRIAVMRLTRRLRTAQADESLTLSQLSALASLDRHGPCSPSALAEIERVQPPSMTRVIAALEERGLALRAPHETDRRQSVIALSEEGRCLLEVARRKRQAWLAQCLDDLPPSDQAALRNALPVLERLGKA